MLEHAPSPGCAGRTARAAPYLRSGRRSAGPSTKNMKWSGCGNTGGKNWTYEYKYRRGGKTLCALYAREGCMGFMVIFGKEEKGKV